MFELLLRIDNEWKKLDFSGEFPEIFITIDNVDVKDITRRGSSFSKTIRLPDSENNRIIFENISHLNSDSLFDPNVRRRCMILQDSIIVFEGYLLLNRYYGEPEYYWEVNIIGEILDLVTKLGEKQLQDLQSLTAYDHVWSVDNVRNSWTHEWQNGWVYPLMDYGWNWDYVNVNGEQGSVQLEEMYPAIFEKVIFNAILNEAGYTYESDTLDREDLKKVVIPFNRAKLPGVSSDGRRFWVANFATQSVLTRGGAGNQGEITLLQGFDSIDYGDPNELWNDTDFWYQNDEQYPISMSFTLLMEFTMSLPFASWFSFWVYTDTNPDGTPYTAWVDSGMTNTGYVFNNWGYPLHGSPNFYQKIAVADPPTLFFTTETGSSTYTTYYTTPFLTIQPGSKVRFALRTKGPYITGLNHFNITKMNISNNINPDAVRGTLLEAKQLMPKGVKQLDFLKSIIKKYNLYIEPIRGRERTLLIETRDVYYAKGSLFDATRIDSIFQLDMSQTPVTEYIVDKVNRRTIFTYKDDRDALNERYKSRFNEVYGTHLFISPNEFASSDGKVDVIFSATPMLDLDGSNIVVPNIVKDFDFSYNDDTKGKIDSNIRCIYWGGLVKIEDSEAEGQFVKFEGETIINSDNEFCYPYAGHLDNPYNPTRDLNWGLAQATFFRNEGLTEDNLFELYWRSTMESLTNKNSKLVTISAFISPIFFNQFNLNDSIYLTIDGEGSYYFINKITNWNPATGEPCKVELFFADRTQARVNKPFLVKSRFIKPVTPRRDLPTYGSDIKGTVTTDGVIVGVGNVVSPWENPNPGIIVGDYNEVRGGDNNVLGSGNIVGSFSFGNIIKGDNNNIGLGTTKVYVFGDNNYIPPETENSYVFGSGLTGASNSLIVGLTTSFLGPVYIDGVEVSSDVLEPSRWLKPVDGLLLDPGNFIEVTGAGTTASNSIYTEFGDNDGKPYYEEQNTYTYIIYWDGSSEEWYIVDNTTSAVLYFSDEDVPDPSQVTTWQIDTGDSPAPQVNSYSPYSIGARYIVEIGAYGAFEFWDGDIAELTDTGWERFSCFAGDSLRTKDGTNIYLRDSTQWLGYDLTPPATPGLPQVLTVNPFTGGNTLFFDSPPSRIEVTAIHGASGSYNLPTIHPGHAWIRLLLSADITISYTALTISREYFFTLGVSTPGTYNITWASNKFRAPNGITLPSTITTGEIWFFYAVVIDSKLNFVVASKLVDV